MALKIINKSFDVLFGKTSSIFVTTSVKKILFDGIPIYCNVTDFSAKAVCAELKKRDQFQRITEDVLGFSFFGLVSIIFSSKWLLSHNVLLKNCPPLTIYFNDSMINTRTSELKFMIIMGDSPGDVSEEPVT